jgi:hypothetical protein
MWNNANASQLPEKERKHFFFEKKKQETFIPGGLLRQRRGADRPTVAGNKSLLVLFFRKEHACYAKL